ncbi:MAG: hypothetical protein VX904_00310, partial [Planctomycetota bacterium]|nr:hypothetical protein [Planctomycetota bacterium]
QAFRDVVSSRAIADSNSRLGFTVRDEVVGHEKHGDDQVREVRFNVAFTSLGEGKRGGQPIGYPGP